jgi:hypothetical protein
MKLTTFALTSDLWPALEVLFGQWGASNGSSCIIGVSAGAYRGKRSQKKRTLPDIVIVMSASGALTLDVGALVARAALLDRGAQEASESGPKIAQSTQFS